MRSLIKSQAQEAPSAQVSVPTPSFLEKMAEMALYGRLWMFANPKTKYRPANLCFHLDVETDGLGKLELRSSDVTFLDGEMPIEQAINNLHEKFVMVKKLNF